MIVINSPHIFPHTNHRRVTLGSSLPSFKFLGKGSFVEAHSQPHSPTPLSSPPSPLLPSNHSSFPLPSSPLPTFQPAMKLSVSSFLSNLTSKKHKPKKSRSISRLEATSFDSTASSSSDESISYNLRSTPQSVLQSSVNDVKISRHELETVLRRLCSDPPTDEEVSAIVAAGDGQGCITMADLGKICESNGEEELREAFKVFDVNGDGKISAEELLEVFVAMGDACTIEDCKRMIGGVDSDGDGLVCFGDFAKMMMVL